MKLNDQVNYWKERTEAHEETMRHLQAYVSSSKFTNSDNMVNASDVILRLSAGMAHADIFLNDKYGEIL